MDEKEIKAIIKDIQASPTECEWVEIKHDDEDPESIGFLPQTSSVMSCLLRLLCSPR